ESECDPQDWVFAGETAVAAAVNALVREIKRRKKPHRPAEMLHGERPSACRKRIELRVTLGRNQRFKSANRLSPLESQVFQRAKKRHASISGGPAGAQATRRLR